MNTQIEISLSKELNELHKTIEGKLRSTVQDAIMAGEILTNVKEKVAHGEFIPWIEKNLIFTRMTVNRYMGLYEYKGKCNTVLHLPEAYKLVAKLESAKKQTENQRAFKRVQEYKKTGVKPEGWRKNTDDKLYQKEIDRDERIESVKRKMSSRQEESEQRKNEDDFFSDSINKLVEHTNKRLSFKEKIRLSADGENDSFIDALMDYLEEMESDSRRIEFCYNIIKVAKNIARELQLYDPQN